MDEILSREQQTMILLCSLPPFHNHFNEMLTYKRECLDIDEVKSSLLSCEKMEHGNGVHLAYY